MSESCCGSYDVWFGLSHWFFSHEFNNDNDDSLNLGVNDDNDESNETDERAKLHANELNSIIVRWSVFSLLLVTRDSLKPSCCFFFILSCLLIM